MKNHSVGAGDSNTVPYTKLTFVYGVQAWAKISLNQMLRGVDFLTYIRLMRAVDSGSVCTSLHPHIEKFHNEGGSRSIAPI